MKYKLLSLLNDYWYRYGRSLMVSVMYFLAVTCWLITFKSRARSFCCSALRYGAGSSSAKLLKKILLHFPFTKEDTTKGVALAEAAGRTIVVKWPEIQDNVCVDKGILIITFTRTFSFYLRNINLEALEKYFHIVLEPSWSGYADPDILAFMGRVEKIFIQASEVQDRAFLNCFPENFIATSFGASDWVDSKRFSPVNTSKIYDSIYIANTNPLKRIKRYLDAVKAIVNSGADNYVGCLVCASWGGAEKLVVDMVENYDLKKNIILKFDLSTEQVIEGLNQSKVNILLSYKEGSNRSLFESIFCGTPVICLYENVGVNKSYINEYTGALIFDSMIEDTLIWMRLNYSKFSSRQWAVDNISPIKTTEKLIKVIMSSHEIKRDVAYYSAHTLFKANNPEVAYLDFPSIRSREYSEQLLDLFISKRNDYEFHLNNMVSNFFVKLQPGK